MAVPPADLLRLVAASKRKPLLMRFPRAKAGAGAVASPAAAPSAPPAAAPAPALALSHEDARARLWARLAKAGVVPHKESNPDLTARKPVGHSSHNLFVKDKKSGQLIMISARQEADIDLKEVAKQCKVKEVRLTQSSKEAFCQERGCITLLSLYNNTQGDVLPAIDKKLLAMPSLKICAGCDDPLNHAQHNVVDVKPQLLLELLKETGHVEPVQLELA